MKNLKHIPSRHSPKQMREELIKGVKRMSSRSLAKLVAYYNALLPCKICGKPVGPKRYAGYCARCEKVGQKRAQDKYYETKGRSKKLEKHYRRLFAKLPENVSKDEVVKALELIVQQVKGTRDSKFMAAVIFVAKRDGLKLTSQDLAKRYDIPVSRVQRIWNRIRRQQPFKDAWKKWLQKN